MSHTDDLYSSLWGEPLPINADGSEAHSDQQGIEHPAPLPEPRERLSKVPAIESFDEADPRPRQRETPRSAMVQHQMVETLKRLEARVGALQNRIEPLTAQQLQDAVAEWAELSTALRRAMADLQGMIDYSRAIVQQLADIQAQAQRGLRVIKEQINVLDRYGRRYPA